MASPAPAREVREVIIITGSNTGVGFETARQLALAERDAAAGERPRTIILACRSPTKAAAAVQAIRDDLLSAGGRSGAVVEALPLDLMDVLSIRSFAAEIAARGLPVHTLINNAGVNKPPMKAQEHFAADGQFVANYLGHFLLTRLLLPVLRRSAPSRVVNVSSYMHRLGVTTFADQCRRSDSRSYSTSKLAQVFHAREIQRVHGSAGVTAFVVHPGACHSDIWRTSPALLQPVQKVVFGALFLTTAQGARPSVHAASKAVSTDANEVEHFGPYPCAKGWSNWLDAWQPSCRAGVFKSATAEVTNDEKIAVELMKLSDELCAEWEEAAKKE